MMPDQFFSGEPAPRLRLMQRSSSHAPHVMRNIRYHVLVNGRPSRPSERQTFSWEKKKFWTNNGAAIAPLHPIHGRTPQPVFCGSVDGKHKQENGGTTEKRSATCLRRNSCAHDQWFQHQIKEGPKLEKLASRFPLFSAQFRHSYK